MLDVRRPLVDQEQSTRPRDSTRSDGFNEKSRRRRSSMIVDSGFPGACRADIVFITRAEICLDIAANGVSTWRIFRPGETSAAPSPSSLPSWRNCLHDRSIPVSGDVAAGRYVEAQDAASSCTQHRARCSAKRLSNRKVIRHWFPASEVASRSDAYP